MNRIARLVVLAATGVSLALTAAPAAAQCVVEEPTIFLYVCL